MDDLRAKYHTDTCDAEKRAQIQKDKLAAAQRAEQAANAAVEKLAREYADKVRALYMIDHDAAGEFAYRLLKNLEHEVYLPFYSSWWDYAEQRIISIAMEAQDEQRDTNT